MQSISSLLKSNKFRLFTEAATSTEETTPQDTTTETTFEKLLGTVLAATDKANTVNEEELFAALVVERINTLKGSDTAKKYQDLFNQAKEDLTKADGYIPVEAAANKALKELGQGGDITSAEADKIYSMAFSAAQLDKHTNYLYDGRGGGADTTIAIAARAEAFASAKDLMAKLDAGTLQYKARSLSDVSVGTSLSFAPNSRIGSTVPAGSGTSSPDSKNSIFLDGANGFLWKPISTNQNRLAVLVDSNGTGDVLSIVLKNKKGKVIERGTYSSYEAGREKYNFRKQGQEYPDNLTVEVRYRDGRVKRYDIAHPGRRYD